MAATRCATALAKENLQWALQAEQLGTGHAVMQAMPNVADDELVLVLYGDVPLIRRRDPAAAHRRRRRRRP